MNPWTNIFRGLILIIGIIVLSFDALLYRSFELQKIQMDTINKQEQIEEQVSSNKFKDQGQKIYFLSKDLRDAQQQIKDQNDAVAGQKDALLQEVEKRQQVEDESKGIQTSLVDIKAEADAIKQDMKGWQKDYVSVLAELSKKMDDSQDEIKGLETNLVALNIPELKQNINSLKDEIEKITHPTDNDLTSTPPAPEKKIERTDIESQ